MARLFQVSPGNYLSTEDVIEINLKGTDMINIVYSKYGKQITVTVTVKTFPQENSQILWATAFAEAVNSRK